MGYCAVYLYQGLSTTFRKINGSQLHTFFVYTYASLGLGCRWLAMTAKLNFRSALFLLLTALVLTFGCKDMKLDIQDSKDRLDVLEGTTIATINEQITAIYSSITDLQDMDETLDGYIKTLVTTAENLQKQINDANAEIVKVESELGEEITALEQSLLNELNSAKEAIQAELSAINKTLDDLKAADTALDKKIADLRTYVDTELASIKDWADATFSTLAQYEQTQTEKSAIKASIEQINTDMAALETRLNGKIATDIKTAIDALRIELNTDHASRIESAVNNLTVAYTAAVSSARSEITTAYTNAISNAIIESESGMKAWVNTKLTQGYYDIATIDGKLQALSGKLDEVDEELQKQIDQQKSDLETAKSELTSAYKKAINDAIQTNNGIISTEIAEAVQKLETKINSRLSTNESQISAKQKGISDIVDDIDTIQKQIESINTTLGALESEDQELNSLIDKLESDYAALLQELEEIRPIDEISKKTIVDDISAIKTLIGLIQDRLGKLETDFVNRIQSLKYIPEYSDGKEELEPVSRTVTLDFLVSPSNQALSITKAWENDMNVLTANLRYTKNPETRTSPLNIPLNVIDVITMSDGQLQVTLAEDTSNPLEEDFLAGIKEAVVYVKISDGNSDIFSDFIELVCLDLSVYKDLSPLDENGTYATANSYIISNSGLYKFKAYKGNSQELAGVAQINHPSGEISYPSVLWESFGTDVLPRKGDLIYTVGYKDEYVYFRVLDDFKEGNAVIAVNDNLDRVLWSWHVWLTDYPQEQVYYNNAGIMMDRNLGATTNSPYEANVVGLEYQWGRKDPVSFSGNKSTCPSSSSYESTSIEYSILHPTTVLEFSAYNSLNGRDRTLWGANAIKSIYDPCPAGWRVPASGSSGIWATAFGASKYFKCDYYEESGVNFSSKLGDDTNIWYPYGCFWGSGYGTDGYGYCFQITRMHEVYPWQGLHASEGAFIRCMKE